MKALLRGLNPILLIGIFLCAAGCVEPGVSETADAVAAPPDLRGHYTLWEGETNEFVGDGPAWCRWQDLHTAEPWLLCAPTMPPHATCANSAIEGIEFSLENANVFSGSTDTAYVSTGPISVGLLPSGETLRVEYVPGTNGTQAYVTFAEVCIIRYYREAL